ncbi:hypothetical protein AMECASPLE_002959 [Ameca splendens]|uniref:Uncharacterized protein n=1 Tax=Ameca splendens TaxID=208324 RepID=A0ABV0ZI74_9TELE
MRYKLWCCPLSPPTLSKLPPCPLSTSFTVMDQGCQGTLFIFLKGLTMVKSYYSPSFLYFTPFPWLKERDLRVHCSFLGDLGNCGFHHTLQRGRLRGSEKKIRLISRNHTSFPFDSVPCFFLIRTHLLLHCNTLLQESLETLFKCHIFCTFTLFLTHSVVT